MVNFFALIDGRQPTFKRRSYKNFRGEVNTFLRQLKQQIGIWKRGAFHSLDLSPSERELYLRLVAKAAPVLFNMGFPDATHHNQQVSRLTASMSNALGARHSEVLQAAFVGSIHDPKLHPALDLSHKNLATHPVVASALAYTILTDPQIERALLAYFHGNARKVSDFVGGAIDALSINNDSRFVQIMFILPKFTEKVSERFSERAAAGFKAIMEARLESACKNEEPPALPDHLHGCLAEIRLDSGLRGLTKAGWQSALVTAGIFGDPLWIFDSVMGGPDVGVTSRQLTALKKAVLALPGEAFLQARVQATTLLHHHQEVRPSGRKAAAALYIADPMMLSPHKVAAVYNTAVIERIVSYIRSFDDNIRLLPKAATVIGQRWQLAVYLSMLHTAEVLSESYLLEAFRGRFCGKPMSEQIDELRRLLVSPETWGRYAQVSGTADTSEDISRVVGELEASYTAVIDQYRNEIQAGKDMDKFFPASYRQSVAA